MVLEGRPENHKVIMIPACSNKSISAAFCGILSDNYGNLLLRKSFNLIKVLEDKKVSHQSQDNSS